MRFHRNPVNLLRAAAVLLVFCHHYAHYFAWNIPVAGVYGGLLGVQLFFLISGYLIIQSSSRSGWAAFLVNRAFRIFPAYWFSVLLFSLLAGGVFPIVAADAPYFVLNLLALSHFSPYALVKFDVLKVS